MTLERRVSIGAGSDKGQATGLAFPSLVGLVDFLNAQRGHEVWWSGGMFRDGRRKAENWEGSSLVSVDVDGPKDEQGKKIPLSDEAWEAACEAFRKDRLPGHWMHRTPHGLRLVALLDRFVTEPAEWSSAATALAQMTDDSLALGERLAPLGLAVDLGATRDRARLFWGPFATVEGEDRNGVGITASQRAPYALDSLRPPQGGYVAGAPRPASRGRRGTSEEWRAARLKYVAANPLPEPGPERRCPACGHGGCVNVLPGDPSRLWCWSTDHGECGRPVADPATAEVRGWMFDALDLAAHTQGKSPTQVLIDAELLTPETARGPDDSLPEVLRPGSHSLPSGDRIEREAKDWAEEVLSFVTEKRMLYRRADRAQVITDGDRLTLATDYDMQSLAGESVRSVEWVPSRKKDKPPTLKWRHHTKSDGSVLREAASKSPHVPRVDVVVNYPVFAGRDMHLVGPGYHDDSSILHLTDPALVDLRATDIGDDLKSTTRALLLSLMEDFPFASRADHENAIMAIFTLLMRPTMPTSPIFYVGAQKAGTGKTMLCQDVIGAIVTGREVGVTNLREGEEREKRISSAALHGDPLIIFDNLDTDVEVAGGSFASFVTASMWNLWILGKTEKVSVRNRSVVMANGNNNAFSDEIARRVWPIMLKTPSARPDERNDFKHPDLNAWIEEMRVPTLAACLGAIHGWKQSGMPRPSSTYSGFRTWYERVGGVMEWLGFSEFGTNIKVFREEVEDDYEKGGRTIIEHWMEQGGGTEAIHTPSELYRWSRDMGLFEQDLHGQPNEEAVFKFGVMRRIVNVPLRAKPNGTEQDFIITRKRTNRGMTLRLGRVQA